MNKLNEVQLNLYHAAYCPYCANVRDEIDKLGIEISLHDISFDAVRVLELVKYGGKRQVPCLQIQAADGNTTWLYESDEIISYLQRHAKNLAIAV